MNHNNPMSNNNLNTHTGQVESCSCITSAAPIPFSTKAMGYDKNQVEQYLQKLTGEYNSLHQNYNDLLSRYNDSANQPGVDIETIGKILVDAQVNAQKIVDEAKTEASGIIREANLNLTLIKNEKTQLLDYLDGVANRLRHLDSANKSDSLRKSISVNISRQ